MSALVTLPSKQTHKDWKFNITPKGFLFRFHQWRLWQKEVREYHTGLYCDIRYLSHSDGCAIGSVIAGIWFDGRPIVYTLRGPGGLNQAVLSAYIKWKAWKHAPPYLAHKYVGGNNATGQILST